MFRIYPYFLQIRKNTVQKKPVFTVVLCSAISHLGNVPVKALPFNEKATLSLSEG